MEISCKVYIKQLLQVKSWNFWRLYYFYKLEHMQGDSYYRVAVIYSSYFSWVEEEGITNSVLEATVESVSYLNVICYAYINRRWLKTSCSKEIKAMYPKNMHVKAENG